MLVSMEESATKSRIVLSLIGGVLAVKDFHTINNMFESLGGQVQRKKNQVLKLFFFAILVQEFEIKVENLCVVKFLPLPVRRVLVP